MIDESAIRFRFETLDPVLDERGRRRLAAAEAMSAGRGGVSAVSRATGLARSTIGRALAEWRGGEVPDTDRVRRAGGGRKALSETDTALQHLETLGNMTHKEPHGFHAFRRLYAYVDHSASPALQQKAAALMTDWSPSLTGFGVSGDALRIDRFGAKRRKPEA